jgi:UDP-N-acetylmuramate--alanine ligase
LTQKDYVFCGIGGSGMLPLAMLVRRSGAHVIGTDRSFDQGKAQEKQAYLQAQGVKLAPQDGSAMTHAGQILVTSTAVEAHVPDVAKAREIGATHIHRADLLSSLFNAAGKPIAIAGTSGKSTITAMLGWILHASGRAPTIVNGAVMANFRNDESQFASFVYGSGADFVAEVDESDGSIQHYNPSLAILSNITIDHKPIAELKVLFAAYLDRAKMAVVNWDDEHVRELVSQISGKPVVSFSLSDSNADVYGIKGENGSWRVMGKDGQGCDLVLKVFGDYNVSNALAAIAASEMLGIERHQAAAHLAEFKGVARRMEAVGQPGGVAVYDDFGHNPDKIAASLAALRERFGRIFCLFQPHGYGPLRVMGDALVETFVQGLRPEDHLWMTDPVYFGGSVQREPIVEALLARIGAERSTHLAARSDFPALVAGKVQPGDAVVIMGARDDTLTDLARTVADDIAARYAAPSSVA